MSNLFLDPKEGDNPPSPPMRMYELDYVYLNSPYSYNFNVFFSNFDNINSITQLFKTAKFAFKMTIVSFFTWKE